MPNIKYNLCKERYHGKKVKEHYNRKKTYKKIYNKPKKEKRKN